MYSLKVEAMPKVQKFGGSSAMFVRNALKDKVKTPQDLKSISGLLRSERGLVTRGEVDPPRPRLPH